MCYINSKATEKTCKYTYNFSRQYYFQKSKKSLLINKLTAEIFPLHSSEKKFQMNSEEADQKRTKTMK